jgi:hypothetical protein
MVYLGLATLGAALIGAFYAKRAFDLQNRQADAEIRRGLTFGQAHALPDDPAELISRMTIDVHAQPGYLHRQVAVWALAEDGRTVIGRSAPRDLAEGGATGFEIPLDAPTGRDVVVIFSLRDSNGREAKSDRRRMPG